jgi:hypothetical protein
MISREWTETAITAGVEEWHRGRESDPTLAPEGVPDLSGVPGYSLEDVRHNCVGLQSPAQKWQATKRFVYQLVGLGIGGVFAVFMLAHGAGLITFIAMIAIGIGALKSVFDFQEVWTGGISRVDGDIWTELHRDSDSGNQYFVHIDGMQLEITKRAFGALVAGGPYRIYYLRGARRAIGGQVLPAWRALPQPEPKKRSWWSGLTIQG